MRLPGPNGDEFELRIAAYQFPEIDYEEYDANWLVVETLATARGRRWQSHDACLLTWEVAWLADWVEAIAARNTLEAVLDFTEPNLRFELEPGTTERIRLRVYFEVECRPEWAPARAAGMNDLWVELECSPSDLRTWAATLREQRAQFPPRAGVGTTRDRDFFAQE